MSWGCWLILSSFFECIRGKCRALRITVRATPAGTEHTEGCWQGPPTRQALSEAYNCGAEALKPRSALNPSSAASFLVREPWFPHGKREG